MALTHDDFLLTDEELSKITLYLDEKADSYSEASEDPHESVNGLLFTHATFDVA